MKTKMSPTSNPNVNLLDPNPVLGSTQVSYKYAAFTRYVTPASTEKLLQGIWWEDINPADVLPAGLALPPIPLAFRYPDSDGSLNWTDPQNANLLLPWAHNKPDENWYYQFAFWGIDGGLNQTPPDRPFGGMPSPIVQVTEDNVVTRAVYDFNGGPNIDTAAWNIRAWILNDHGSNAQHPLGGNFFHVATAPTSQERDDRANAGLVDTETYGGVKLVLPQVVEAVASIPPTNPFSIEQLEFSHWTLNHDFSNLIPTPAIVLDPKTSGRAIAWYKFVPREGADPEANIPDWLWKFHTRGGKVPPPPWPPWAKGRGFFGPGAAQALRAIEMRRRLGRVSNGQNKGNTREAPAPGRSSANGRKRSRQPKEAHVPIGL